MLFPPKQKKKWWSPSGLLLNVFLLKVLTNTHSLFGGFLSYKACHDFMIPFVRKFADQQKKIPIFRNRQISGKVFALF